MLQRTRSDWMFTFEFSHQFCASIIPLFEYSLKEQIRPLYNNFITSQKWVKVPMKKNIYPAEIHNSLHNDCLMSLLYLTYSTAKTAKAAVYVVLSVSLSSSCYLATHNIQKCIFRGQTGARVFFEKVSWILKLNTRQAF